MTNPFTLPYSSTKFALNGFFGSLNHELAMKKSNVSISICTLGLIDTDSAMEKVRFVKYLNIPYTHTMVCENKNSCCTYVVLFNYMLYFFPHLRGVTEIPAYPATEAALNIIITGTTRQLDLYYPWFTHIINLIKDWSPSITNYITQNSYNYVP